MSRVWNEMVAAIGDGIRLPLLALLMVVAAALVAALWQTYPAWVPRRWPRLRVPRRPQRPQTETTVLSPEELDDLEPEALPDVPAVAFLSRADRYAAEGRYAEAVRERLRAVVRLLVDRRIIEHRPGWTVTELAREAGRARPATDEPLRAAARIFSDIWYGGRTATADDDATMRDLAAVVDRAANGGRALVAVGVLAGGPTVGREQTREVPR